MNDNYPVHLILIFNIQSKLPHW